MVWTGWYLTKAFIGRTTFVSSNLKSELIRCILEELYLVIEKKWKRMRMILVWDRIDNTSLNLYTIIKFNSWLRIRKE